jgi:hypothetical protein
MLFVFTATLAHAADWPCWRGPTGMGVTDARDLPLTWGNQGENVLWKSPLPGTDTKATFDHNQSSPIVWKDRIFLVMVYWPKGFTPSEFPEHHVACYWTEDGKQLWDCQVQPGPWLLKDLRGGYSAPTPCTDGERVYVLFGSSALAALDFNGKQVWPGGVAQTSLRFSVTSPLLEVRSAAWPLLGPCLRDKANWRPGQQQHKVRVVFPLGADRLGVLGPGSTPRCNAGFRRENRRASIKKQQLFCMGG